VQTVAANRSVTDSTVTRFVSSLSAAAAGFAIAAVPLCATAAASDGQPVFLPYVNAPSGAADIAVSPQLRISFGGSTHLAVMDTGSTGIVVSAGDIPGVDALPSTPGRLLYSSSGRMMMGKWVSVPVTIAGSDGTKLTTPAIPVLAITAIACAPKARDCKTEEQPKGVAVLGIGFGREADGQEQSTPDKNAFLAASAALGPGRRGYIVTRTGVQVGLAAADLAGGFALTKLTADPAHAGDWLGAPFCVTLNGKTPATCGASLVDTGVTGMYLTLPPAAVGSGRAKTDRGEATLADGTKVAFVFAGTAGAQATAGSATYAFTVGQAGNPLAPGFLILNTDRPQPFVNTSVRFLNGFDYLFDADDGMVGYRWTGRADASIGGTRSGP
jgi:hypothetical protein